MIDDENRGAGRSRAAHGSPDTLDGRVLVHAYGFPHWKHRFVHQCLQDFDVVFVKRGESVPPDADLAVWGMDNVPCPDSATRRVMRIEDGFLRSVGLGADIVRPLSWVLDTRGMHYDAGHPSDIEVLLASITLNATQSARATSLRDMIVRNGVTKYNVGRIVWTRPAGGKPVVLVPGQVESDASLRYGAPPGARNMDLLRRVRKERPDAWLIYKPHPDVVARMRLPGDQEAQAAHWCDEVVVDVSIAALLPQVDELHVWTSLAGFEALLHGKPVTCHGQPFYSGWGLTRDMLPHPRRTRRLTLEELVHGALIDYPTYLSADDDTLITPEQAVESLIAWRARAPATDSWRTQLWRFFVRRIAGVR